MNSAYLKRQRAEDRASALMGVLGAVLLAGLAVMVLVGLAHAWQFFPTAWWLEPSQRPFGGAL